MKPLISVDELAALIDQGDVLVVDCRNELGSPDGGRLAWSVAHIPGAIHASLDSDLSDLTVSGQGRHPLPDEAAFSEVLAHWGWCPDRPLIAYDDAGGALAAARLWWMLRLVGAQSAGVLDGGWSAWQASALPTETGERIPGRAKVSAHYDPGQLVGYEALQSSLDDESIRLLDARAAPRYRGEVEPLDPVAGHVPGARNRPYTDNLEANGRFKSPRQLAAEFRTVIGDHAPQAVIHMCGSGVTACHNLLAMEIAGLHGSRMFAPSWSGWISDPRRAVAVGVGP